MFCLSNYDLFRAIKTINSVECAKKLYGRSLVTNSDPSNLQFEVYILRKWSFFHNLTKIGADKNKAIYSNHIRIYKVHNSTYCITIHK